MSRLASWFLAILLAVPAGTAYAQTADNTATGPDSDNSAAVEQTSIADIHSVNTAHVTYNLDLDLTTGGNTVRHNTAAGTLQSGSIAADLDLASSITQAAASCDGCLALGSGEGRASNTMTGPDSVNEASMTWVSDIEVRVRNRADVHHNLTLAANTGGNRCTDNTVVGDCRSGDIRVGIERVTEVHQGVGGAIRPPGPPGGEEGVGGQPGVLGAVQAAGVGGALFAAGSSLFLLLGLIAAANILYLVRRYSLRRFTVLVRERLPNTVEY